MQKSPNFKFQYHQFNLILKNTMISPMEIVRFKIADHWSNQLSKERRKSTRFQPQMISNKYSSAMINKK